jgi:deoxyribose-phosphate aldolase
MIDHSLLNPVMTRQDVIDGCEIAKKYSTATVCVKPCDVGTAAEALGGTGVLVTTVVGFPHGCHATETKVFEAERAIAEGCRELDMVLNAGRLLGGEHDCVRRDIQAVCDAARKAGVLVKVIFENAYLDDGLIVAACRLAGEAGADFVKTSTGYAKSGARLRDLRLMKASVAPGIQVKAAGGIRTLDAALRVRAAGAARIGATATIAIMEEALRRESLGELAVPADDGGEL